MPYPNEHSARLTDPDKYKRIRRENDKFGAGIDAIWGVLPDNTVELQAIRFDASRFTAEEARKWLADHDHKPLAFEKAADTQAALLLSLQTRPAISLSGARIESGVPVRRYRKELIRVGKYIKASDDIAFEVTDRTLDHWVATFAHWTAEGNRVPIPATHRDPSNPDQNRGWLVAMYREGTSLIGIIDLIGDGAAKLALASDVSIFVPAEFTDGKGNVYLRPITHVALCTNPVIPGLGGFEAIAASLDLNTSTKETEMKDIATALGLKEDASLEEILAAIAELKKAGKDVEASLTAKVAALELSLKPKTPDPLLVRLASENRDMKLKALVAGARITPAVKDDLAKRYVAQEALALSLAKGDDGFDALVEILAKNDPVALREQTGPQVLALSGGPGKTEVNPLAAEIERRRAAAEKKGR